MNRSIPIFFVGVLALHASPSFGDGGARSRTPSRAAPAPAAPAGPATATAIKLPAAVVGGDDTPWIALELESNGGGQHSRHVDIQSIEELDIYCEPDASQCRDNVGGASDYAVEVNGKADPTALANANASLVGSKFQPIPYADIAGTGSAKLGNATVTFAASDKDHVVMTVVTPKGKQTETISLTHDDSKARATVRGVARWNGWLLVKVSLAYGDNKSTTWWTHTIQPDLLD